MHDQVKISAKQAYDHAEECALHHLPLTHPIRLGIALNYAIFQYDVLGDLDDGYATARTALDQVIAETTNGSGEVPVESAFILSLLRKNVSVWSERPGGWKLVDVYRCRLEAGCWEWDASV